MHYGKISGPYITINSKKLINFCSNDYLGLTTKSNFKNQTQSSSRLVSGNDTLFKTLEKKLARHKSQENSLVFPTGYMTNLGAISTLVPSIGPTQGVQPAANARPNKNDIG